MEGEWKTNPAWYTPNNETLLLSHMAEKKHSLQTDRQTEIDVQQ